ncbi:unnamed protein product [Dovyalis caffra]|uniref:DUF7138 domain-containing protein n=1 Tax=Dovyalis caffra TaxID=77055 RepID=A0AAV1RYL2_9ROSI|nr:unnamed protein product [Dovyalis caffra]
MMKEAATGERFPVVLFDGEQDTRVGDVVVLPTLNFRGLQLIISERIGISPQKFSIFLANREKMGSRIPVTAKTNFSEIYRENDWLFLVVLKRSRRESRIKEHEMMTGNTVRFRFDPPPGNLRLLRRDGNSVAINGNGLSGLDLGWVEYERRVRELRMEKERYLMNMGLGTDPGVGHEGLSLGETERRDRNVVCEECSRAKRTGMDPGFHWCVYDTVTFGFRSSAGPIARPIKRPS